ncbi:SpoIIE family protein phosphatase [Streptomyces sp. NPDC052287]|uniref:SpoIIE family protein phosphatase n=1 Tax=Streptomyces sp. NPDC052287 TaxID=3154950 RepID=UPI00342AB938
MPRAVNRSRTPLSLTGRRLPGRRERLDQGADPDPDPAAPRRGRLSLLPHSIAGQMLALAVTIAVLLIAAATTVLVLQDRKEATQEARTRALAVAETFAHSPAVLDALKSASPSTTLQPLAEATRRDARVAYIVVTNPKGIRYSHPDPRAIGLPSNATVWPATAGHTFTDKVIGRSLHSPSIRAVVPVFDARHSVVGTVMTGVPVASVVHQVNGQLPPLLGSAGVALALSMGGIAWLSKRLRRQTHGLGPTEITRMYEHHDAVLHAVREGVLIADHERRLLLANDEAHRLLGLPPDVQGRHAGDLALGPALTRMLTSGRVATDEVHPAGDRLLAVNQQPTVWNGRVLGTVTTLRDTTELRSLAGQADVARERLRLLYDAGMTIGTTLDVGRIAEELVAAVVPRFADHAVVDLSDAVLHGEEPPGDGTGPLCRAAQAPLPGTPSSRAVGDLVRFPPSSPQARSLKAQRPVAEPDPAGEPVAGPHRTPGPLTSPDLPDHAMIAVPLRARGAVLGLVSLFRATTSGSGGHSPFDTEDLSLAEELVNHTAVCIDNARRYAREHATAVSLQRSLLPHGLPEQNAVDAASRYLPGQATTAGGWFDVIPLSSARVALVAGDVTGHGLHAAVAMGRLRTAVHNFSDLDLVPEELMARLDDLVIRLDRDEGRPAGGEQRPGPAGDADGSVLTGATCLYVVYDPVRRQCVMARAGHPLPVLILPDGTADFPRVRDCPALGLGGQPFESLTVDVPENSRLVLYTDGLLKHHNPEPATGQEWLRQVLARPGRSPQETCDAVLDALVPDRLGHPGDDIALLVARTRALDDEHLARWDVPADPATVAGTRAAVERRLTDWGLDDTVFTTELILSELITNAIRYASPPIELRLLRDRTLICEVSDAGSTSPHVRRAATTDEGGRGLFLISQLTQRWGTRYTPRGKVVWTEQSLPTGEEQEGLGRAANP